MKEIKVKNVIISKQPEDSENFEEFIQSHEILSLIFQCTDVKKQRTAGKPSAAQLFISYLLTASLRDLPALNTGALEAGISMTVSGF